MRHVAWRWRRASALDTFSLLTSAATASAECAWVLWLDQTIGIRETKNENGRAKQEWTPVTATGNSRDCARNLEATIKTQSKPRPDENVEVGVNTIFKRTATRYMSLRYVCLPDTVDPRGPKGGRDDEGAPRAQVRDQKAP
jgi:hypothetical protein